MITRIEQALQFLLGGTGARVPASVLHEARGEVCNGEELDTKGGGRFWVGAVVLHHSQIDSFVCSMICQAKRRFVSSQS